MRQTPRSMKTVTLIPDRLPKIISGAQSIALRGAMLRAPSIRKLLLAITLTCTLAGVVAFAGPLKKEHVAADAKWLIHLDVENLFGTQIGSFLANEILDKQFAKYRRDF